MTIANLSLIIIVVMAGFEPTWDMSNTLPIQLEIAPTLDAATVTAFLAIVTA